MLVRYLFLSTIPNQISGFHAPANTKSARTLFCGRLNLFASNEAKTMTSLQQQALEGPALPPLPSTAKRMFLVRHGEVINPGGDRNVYYGAMDVLLSELGEQEATAAGVYLSQFDLAHVFCSPLTRAVYGAEQVAKRQANKSIDIVSIPGFKELDRGDWCGKTKEEIGEELMNAFDACDESVTPVNGESFPALKQRVLEALNTALGKMQPGESACLVSHLQVTRSILSQALGVPTNQMTKLPVSTASVTCVDYDFADGAVEPQATVHFQSYKPEVGLAKSKDGAN